MKKLITIILILSLILPASALAVTGDSPYFGRWIAQKHGSTANCSAILYYLYISKYTPSAYFELWIQEGGDFTKPNIEKQELYDSHWEIVDNHIQIPTSPISYIEVYYDKDTDTLYTTEWPNLTFVRIP
jgi:hypothetical protein